MTATRTIPRRSNIKSIAFPSQECRFASGSVEPQLPLPIAAKLRRRRHQALELKRRRRSGTSLVGRTAAAEEQFGFRTACASAQAGDGTAPASEKVEFGSIGRGRFYVIALGEFSLSWPNPQFGDTYSGGMIGVWMIKGYLIFEAPEENR
jgi:hypothetical protein